MAQLKKSEKTGLGDELEHKIHHTQQAFSTAEIEILSEIEALTKQLTLG